MESIAGIEINAPPLGDEASTLEDRTLSSVVEGVQAFTKRVHHEDIRACEATWAGLVGAFTNNNYKIEMKETGSQCTMHLIQR